MSRIMPEKEISYISKVIEKNLYYYDTSLKDKGFLSENILAQLRNLVEDVIILVNNKLNELELDTHYNNVGDSIDAIKGKSKYKFLIEFHNYLQGTASHYTPNEDSAERLVKYYYRYICMIKILLKDEFDIEIIKNIDLFPIYDDKSMKENYDIISDTIKNADSTKRKLIKGKFYVENINTIYSNGNIYYEITLSKASDYNNKFERLTFYSKEYIPDNYSVNIYVIDEIVNLNVGEVKIKIIDSYKVAIRLCELKNIFKIFGETKNFGEKYKEYRNLMDYLTDNITTINQILRIENDEFKVAIEFIEKDAENHYISYMLKKMRDFVIDGKPGRNIILYLTSRMVNTIIREQLAKEPHSHISNLYIHKKSGMFDAMPYAMSLHNHNPNYYDLIHAIDINDRDDELFYSYIRKNVENNGKLYTAVDEIEYFDNIQELIGKYNSKLLTRIPNSKGYLVLESNYVYIYEYELNSIKIIKKLNEYANKIDDDLNTEINFYIDVMIEDNVSIDKIDILRNMFKFGSISLIYGAAGTGKTKMIEIVSNAFSNYKKCIIANTNTAVSNLKNRLPIDADLDIMTINYYLRYYQDQCDLLIIDECSTVNNNDMLGILNKSNYKAIVMVGDIYQIESIQYGNWFKICSRYYNNDISNELNIIHRTTDDDLLELWNCVRNNDDRAISIMSNKEYSEPISENIFLKSSEEEVILCLNYDGMYGINNINRVMQNTNQNKEYIFGVDTFKIDDPILFNDCPRFRDFLHNNLKGKIVDIEEDEDSMWFSIEIDSDSVTPLFAPSDIEIRDSDKNNKLIVRFKVNEFKDMDDDENEYNHIIPFNLSYAISIHKAQGLEYDTVKVVITSNIEDRITKNIFYTAITRAKKKLKVYWSSDTQEKIFENFKKYDSKRDLGILNQKFKKLNS